MRTTLFYIPTELTLGSAFLPLFGWGAFFFVWLFLGTTAFVFTSRQKGCQEAIGSLLLPLAISGAVIVWGLPALDDGHGIPVRGYGTMLIAAAAAGTWLSIIRGRKVGIDADSIIALGLEVFLAGIVGARIFFVIEYLIRFLSFAHLSSFLRGSHPPYNIRKDDKQKCTFSQRKNPSITTSFREARR